MILQTKTEAQQAYANYLQSPHWRQIRLEALERDKNNCSICGATENLHVHHLTYENKGKELLGDLTTLCKDCHAKEHDLTDSKLWQKKHLDVGDRVYFNHGNDWGGVKKIDAYSVIVAPSIDDEEPDLKLLQHDLKIPFGAVKTTCDATIDKSIYSESFYYTENFKNSLFSSSSFTPYEKYLKETCNRDGYEESMLRAMELHSWIVAVLTRLKKTAHWDYDRAQDSSGCMAENQWSIFNLEVTTGSPQKHTIVEVKTIAAGKCLYIGRGFLKSLCPSAKQIEIIEVSYRYFKDLSD